MEVTYQLEREDYLQYNRFVINRVPALKRQTLLSLFIVPVILAVEFKFLRMPLLFYVLIVFSVTVGWGVFLFWMQRRAVIAQATARPGAIGLHTLSLQPEGLREQNSVLEAWIKWQKFAEIAESPQMIVLLISPRYGFLVPKRAFQTLEQAQTFLETAQAYRQSALDGTTPNLPSLPETWPPAPQRIFR